MSRQQRPLFVKGMELGVLLAGALILSNAWLGGLAQTPGAPADEATASVDSTRPRQTIVGFGGDFAPWLISGLSAGERRRLLSFIFSELGINFVRMDQLPYEGATAENYWGAPDNSGPFQINWSAFNFCTKPDLCNDDWGTLLPQLRSFGVDGEYFGLIQGPRWNGFDGHSVFSEDEMVKNQLALFLHYRDRLGLTVRWVAPFSEPGGGGIDWPISAAQAASVVAKLGTGLEAWGFKVKMIIPDATSVRQSIEYAQTILADPRAWRYVGAIGYHTYDTKDGGAYPSGEWIASHEQLRDLAASYGLPTRMTEYCCLDGLLPRANHIYNELEYAGSQTYFPQFVVRKTGRTHRGNFVTDADPESIVVYTMTDDGRLAGFSPTRYTGIAIGHYSRYARPGSVRLPTSLSDPGVRVQAFRGKGDTEMTMVIINNHGSPRRITVTVSGGLKLQRLTRGEQTTENGTRYWTPVSAVSVVPPSALTLSVPGRSVTSLGVSLRP